jgi:hypothetical protein
MDLKDFVAETLVQIVEGVEDARKRVEDKSVGVNPQMATTHDHAGAQGLLHIGGQTFAQVVQFDVALTVLEGKGTKGGIGIFAGGIGLGSSGQSQTENSSVSRVKFSIPLVLPTSSRK